MPSFSRGDRSTARRAFRGGRWVPQRRSAAWLLWTSTLLSCVPRSGPAPEPWREADASEWQAVHRALEAERAARPHAPWTAVVHATIHEPRSGRDVDGRGGLAVWPDHALRMILVGPAGSTLLDAWVTPDRWRIAVPPADIVRRGGPDEPDDLPIGFLRWSFFRPLAGTLVAGSLSPRAVFVLRDGDARVTVERGVCERGERTTTERWVRGRTERLDECLSHGVPQRGDWVRYEDQARRLRVALVIESSGGAPPDAAAFVDPDRAEPQAR